MASEPTDDYLWAESAAGGDVSDPTAKRSAGYLFEDPWPHEEANFMFRAIGRWIDWFKTLVSPYSTLQEAIADTEIGDTFVVDSLLDGSEQLQTEPEEVGSWTTGNTADPTWIDVDGEKLVIGYTGNLIEVYDLSDPTTIEQTLNFTTVSGADIKCLLAGDYVVGINSQYAECWDIATGTSQWEHDYTTNIRDVAVNGDRVCIVGDRTAGTITHQELDLASGSSTGTYDWGADCYAITTYGDNWAFTGDDGGSGGTDQFGVLSRSLSALNVSIDPSVTIAGSEYRNMTCDGRLVVVHNGDTGAVGLVFNPEDGEEIYARNIPFFDGSPNSFYAADADIHGALFSFGDSSTWSFGRFDPVSGTARWRKSLTCDKIFAATDGHSIWALVLDPGAGGASNELRQYQDTDSYPRRWKRIDPSARGYPFPGMKAIPHR